MADSENESDFASAESDQEEQNPSPQQPKPEAAASHMESKSSEKGNRTEERGSGEVLRKSTTLQHAGEKVAESVSGEEDRKKSQSPPIESERTEAVESSVKEKGSLEKVKEKEEEKQASEKRTDEQASTEMAVTGGVESKEKEGEHKQEAKAAGGGGGWGWGGWSSIWSSMSTVTESTAQALGEKVSSVIASVEDTLGLPSPHELAEEKEEEEESAQASEETSRLAAEIVEHDVPPEDKPPVQEEPHSSSIPETREPEQDQQAHQQHSPVTYDSFAGFFTGIASVVQTTSKGLMSGGLDALEMLGKKTMEVLSEGDPGLRKKRSMVAGGEAPTLSQLLMEAKSETEAVAKMREGKGDLDDTQLVLSYSRLFDEYQGVVHLEALELLSKECESKLRSRLANLSEEETQSLKEELDKITQALKVEEPPEDVLEDDSSHLPEVLELFSDVTLPLKVDKLIKVSSSWREKVRSTSSVASEQKEKTRREEDAEGEKRGEEAGEAEKGEEKIGGEEKMTERTGDEMGRDERTGGEIGEKKVGEETKGVGMEGDDKSVTPEGSENPKEEDEKKREVSQALYESGLRSLVELTSVSIELFRKMAEISLLPDVQKMSALVQAQKLNRLTVLVSSELDSLASVHAEAITTLDVKDSNSSITSLYLEASNSSSYVQDAFQLLCPVLQLTTVQQSTKDPLL